MPTPSRTRTARFPEECGGGSRSEAALVQVHWAFMPCCRPGGGWWGRAGKLSPPLLGVRGSRGVPSSSSPLNAKGRAWRGGMCPGFKFPPARPQQPVVSENLRTGGSCHSPCQDGVPGTPPQPKALTLKGCAVPFLSVLEADGEQVGRGRGACPCPPPPTPTPARAWGGTQHLTTLVPAESN